ncbi:MAG: hypothetical protein R3F10_04670 [Lysobacteraceae bacterium]
MIQSRIYIAVVVLVGTACAAPQARAADERTRLPETVHRIERETGGKVLSAQRSSHNGQEATRIKVYTPEGRVRVMWDQPQRERPVQPQLAPRPQMVRPERPEMARPEAMRQSSPMPMNPTPHSAPQPPRRDRR